MKALSLTQPWATLVLLGVKRYETRSWQTAYRGPLAIHAARTFPQAARTLCRLEPFPSALAAAGIHHWTQLPRGAVIGVVELCGCVPVELLPPLSPEEEAFGDYRPGRWAWELAIPTPLAAPLPCRGRLGLFDVPEPITV
jgi:hypothetical protein